MFEKIPPAGYEEQGVRQVYARDLRAGYVLVNPDYQIPKFGYFSKILKIEKNTELDIHAEDFLTTYLYVFVVGQTGYEAYFIFEEDDEMFVFDVMPPSAFEGIE
jgi:hypothetical protein